MAIARVRRCRTLADLAAVSRLQAQIWQSPEMAAPSSLLRAMADSGGIVLLATVAGEPVGFCFGFTGRSRDGHSYHRSHAAGLLPPAQGQGLGRRLKLAQRRAALAIGLTRMVWTFDPVQTRNAHFNLHRLGAIARGYHADYYGARVDAFNGGLPSDRLVAEWFLAGPERRVVEGLRRRPGRGAPAAAVPMDLRGLAARDPGAARGAHLGLRRALRRGLADGLVLVDFDAGSNRYRFAAAPIDGLPPPP
ncbi:MAG TPA: GNAT family N-acetyltransferase [Candidatus Micrarchaeia archaeon]|nr:GNAT family N-acetyltransferase [Candidatus Micrarchaeia archaeon]